MELLNLPNEMLERIAAFLPPTVLTRLGETCKLLNNIVNIDSLWQSICWQEFRICKKDGWNLTFKEIYVKILQPLPVLGLKRVALIPHGGLIHSKWCEGKIMVNRLRAGDHIKAPLTSEPVFTVQWNADKEDLEVKCVQGSSESAQAKIAQIGKFAVLQCCDKTCFVGHKRKAEYLGQTHPTFPDGFTDFPDVFNGVKSDFLEGFNCPLLPLRSHAKDAICPVTPGIYKGDYGAHGVEILQACIDEEQPYLLECLKLTGDPNIPAGNVSIKVNLDYPIILPDDEQNSISEIIQMDLERGEEAYKTLRQSNNGSPDLRQPFHIPRDCTEWGIDIPKTCLARFSGHGRIAGHFFSSPSHCRLHFIKFDDDTFGVLWLDLYCFSVFHREKQDFSISAL